MQTRKHTKKLNKPALIITTVLAIGLVAFLVYAFILKPNNEKSTDTNKSIDTNTSSEQQPEEPIENPDDKTKAPNTDSPAQPTPTPGSDKEKVQMVASVDQSNGTVYLRGGINYPVTGGSCYAQLIGPSGQSIRKESAVLSNPSSTDCKTILIPVTELSSGQWKFTLHYTSEDFEGVSSEELFTL